MASSITNVTYPSISTAPVRLAPHAKSTRGKPSHGDEQLHRLNGAHGGPRVALYSHDTMGLGHLRRNLLIAKTLSGTPLNATNLLITGAHEANFFRLPDRSDCLTLPRLKKNGSGDYAAGQLDISRDDLTELRARSICSSLEVFRPDVFIVDKVPTGAFHELVPALEMLARGRGTKCVLGLRDILDDPISVRRECLNAQNLSAIEHYYDAIWVYGDAKVYDPVAEYALPEPIARRLQFTGYIDQSGRVGVAEAKTIRLLDSIAERGPIVACLVGGGQDGALIARTFIDAMPDRGRVGVVVTGPFMTPAEMDVLAEMAAERSNIHLMDFVPEADLLIERAERVVAMAGYNTVCSLLSFGKKALLVPRVYPRAEQLIRAERLQQLGFVDMLTPTELTIDNMRRWILQDYQQPRCVRGAIDFKGLATLTGLTRDLVEHRATAKSPISLPATA